MVSNVISFNNPQSRARCIDPIKDVAHQPCAGLGVLEAVMGRMIPCVCVQCGKHFTTEFKRLKRGGGRFCSHHCHGLHLWRNGALKKYKPTAEKFWNKVDKSGGTDACWPWTGKRSKQGYGAWWDTGSSHRGAYLYTFGEFDRSLCVCHHCDNPPCCNPKHLFLGTRKDNADDRDRKHRRIAPAGEEQGNAKLTWEAVGFIREHPEIELQELADQFGVDKSTIWLVRRNKSWRQQCSQQNN